MVFRHMVTGESFRGEIPAMIELPVYEKIDASFEVYRSKISTPRDEDWQNVLHRWMALHGFAPNSPGNRR